MATKLTVFLFLTLAVAALFGSSVYLQQIFSDSVQIFEVFADEHPVAAPLSFILLAIASVVLGPFSSIPLTPFAIAAWGVPLTLFYTMCGWFIGGAIAYAVGRYAGKPVVGWIIGSERLEEWLAAIRPKLTFPILLLFRLAMPAETGYVFGIVGYNLKRYLLIIFLAEIPFALLGVYASKAFLDSGWATFGTLALITLFLIAFSYKHFSSRLK